MAKYKITEQPYFRGKLFPVGSIVTIPDDEKPAPAWIPLNDDGTPKPPAPKAPPPKSK
jgi:hypothetical protein